MIEMKITATDGQDLLAQLLALGQAVFPAAAIVTPSATAPEVPTTESPKAPDPEKKRGRPPKVAQAATSSPEVSLDAPQTSDASTAAESSAHPLEGLSDDAVIQALKDKLTQYLRVFGEVAAFEVLRSQTGVKRVSEVKPEKRVEFYDYMDKELKKND